MKKLTLFENRRTSLANTYNRTLFVIPSGVEAVRSHSVRYRFKVSSDFYFLSGLSLSEAILIMAGDKTYLLQKQGQDAVWGEHTGSVDFFVSAQKTHNKSLWDNEEKLSYDIINGRYQS